MLLATIGQVMKRKLVNMLVTGFQIFYANEDL